MLKFIEELLYQMLLFWLWMQLPYCNIGMKLVTHCFLLSSSFQRQLKSTKRTLRSRTRWQGWALIQLLSHVFFYLLHFVHDITFNWQGLVVVNLKMIMILWIIKMISSPITIMMIMIKEILLIMIMLIMTGPCQHNGDADPFCRRYWYVQGGPTLLAPSGALIAIPTY